MASKIPKSDSALFRAAMKDVKRLQQDKVTLDIKQLKQSPKIKIHGPWLEEEIFTNLNDYVLEEISAESMLSFKRSGVQANYFKKLQKGLLPIEAEIDLHGLPIEQAKIACLKLIKRSVAQQKRVIKIIHGKGYRSQGQPNPILKNRVNYWLQQLAVVIAFCSAMPKDGGAGAVYVLLRRVDN